MADRPRRVLDKGEQPLNEHSFMDKAPFSLQDGGMVHKYHNTSTTAFGNRGNNRNNDSIFMLEDVSKSKSKKKKRITVLLVAIEKKKLRAIENMYY